MPRENRKYVVHDTTDGIDRWYFRRKGQPKIRLPGFPGSDDFNAAYYKALNGKVEAPAPGGIKLASEQTFRWLGQLYLSSGEMKQLDPHTVHVRRLIFQSICLEPVKPGSDKLIGDMPLPYFGPQVVGMLMERKAATPDAANNRRRLISQIFGWAMKPARGHVTTNPARDVDKLRTRTGGYHSWTDEQLEQFEKRHPIGTKARLAYALHLKLSQRRSDVVLFGRQHVKDGWLHFTQFKGRNVHPVTLELPIDDELQAVIDASPCGDLTFLVTEFGRPFTANGYGNKFRVWCNQAGLPPECSSHGLRKAGARLLAERGKTGHEIKAVTGHRNLKEVDRYTEAVRQRQLAGTALLDSSGTKVSSPKRG